MRELKKYKITFGRISQLPKLLLRLFSYQIFTRRSFSPHVAKSVPSGLKARCTTGMAVVALHTHCQDVCSCSGNKSASHLIQRQICMDSSTLRFVGFVSVIHMSATKRESDRRSMFFFSLRFQMPELNLRTCSEKSCTFEVPT